MDGPSPLGDDSYVLVEDPITLEERRAVARVCLSRLALEPMPALVDELDDSTADAYAAHPDRMYLIGRDGRVSYRGGAGPFGFLPDELEDAIRAELGLEPDPVR